MELVYLWVKEYKNIEKQGFNFSPRFRCAYDPDTNELVIDENEDYVDIFPDNINVTAIVGKNGSGKSSVLELLKICLTQNINENNKFIIFYDKGTQEFYSSSLNILSSIPLKKLTDTKVITHTPNNLDWYLFMNQNTDLYVLENDMLKEAFENSIPTDDLFWSTFKFDIMYYRALSQNFLLKFFLEKDSNLFFPDKFVLHLSIDFFINKISSILSYRVDESFEIINQNIKLLLLEKNGNLKFFNRLYLFLKKIKDNSRDTPETNLIVSCYIKKRFHEDNVFEQYLKSEQNFLKLLDDYLDTQSFELSEKKEIILSLLKNEITQFIFSELYSIVLFESKTGKQFKDLSTGEKDFLLILAVLYKHINDKFNLILLDEIESFFHPRWSKNIFSNLCTELQMDDNHLILTTHSPFLLSDIPKQNIIFLDTYKKEDEEVKSDKQKVGNCKVVDGLNDKKETFGANIHTLLSDSFFMEDGLMGEFAKGKIESIRKFYNKVIKYKDNDKVKKAYKCFYEKKQKEFWDIQSIIGEPFLQKIVKNQLEEIEFILFKEKAKEIAIKRFISEFGEDAIKEVMSIDKN